MKSRVVLVVSQSKKLTHSENNNGNAKKTRNPSRLGDRKASPLSASSVLALVPKCLAAGRDHISRVASAAPTVSASAPSVSGRVTLSPNEEISPDGSASITNHTPASAARPQPALRRLFGTGGGRVVGQQLAGDQDPQQPDADHEEWDERLVEALAEVADRLVRVEQVQCGRGGDQGDQVVDRQRRRAGPPCPGRDAVGAGDVSDEGEAEEALECVARHPRELVSATSAGEQDPDHAGSGTDEVPDRQEFQARREIERRQSASAAGGRCELSTASSTVLVSDTSPPRGQKVGGVHGRSRDTDRLGRGRAVLGPDPLISTLIR